MKDRGVNSNGGAETQTSLTLLDRVRRKDKEAWERLVSLYTPLVYYWCRQSKLQPADAEEVTQDVFLAVARGLVNFHRDQEGDTFRGWLRKITWTKICDHAPPPGGKGEGGSDAQKRLKKVPSPDPVEQANADSEAAESNILFNRAVELIEAFFEPKSRRAFWLLIAGRTGKEVGAELQMSVRAVYIAKARILKRLREEFRGLLDTSHAT